MGKVDKRPPSPSSASVKALFKKNGIISKNIKKLVKGSEKITLDSDDVDRIDKAVIMGNIIGNNKRISIHCSLDAIINILLI